MPVETSRAKPSTSASSSGAPSASSRWRMARSPSSRVAAQSSNFWQKPAVSCSLMMLSVTRPTVPSFVSARFEDDDRDLPIGLRLVVGEAGPLRLVRLPDLVALVTLGDPGAQLLGLGAYLGGDIRVGDEVVVPVRVRRCSRLRREHRER